MNLGIVSIEISDMMVSIDVSCTAIAHVWQLEEVQKLT